MPDDERTRRRLGDATKANIADLADGWSTPSVPVATAPAPEPAAPEPRKKRKTQPPPPPGSKARIELESAILESREATPVPTRTKAASVSGSIPPTPPAGRPRPTQPPPVPPAQPPTVVDVAPYGVQRGDDSLGQLASLQPPEPVLAPPIAAPAPRPKSPTSKVPNVPLGEFDDGRLAAGSAEDAARAKAQLQHTFRRDAAEALLKMPPPPPPAATKPTPPAPVEVASISNALRGEPTAIEAEYERGDPTEMSVGNVTQSASVDGPASTLRAAAKLRRKRGALGDVRYVFTVWFGVRRTRAELSDLQVRQDTKQASRHRHLVTLGRTAMLSEYKHAAMDESRVSFEAVEDERADHAGQVAAADAELERVRRDRANSAEKHRGELADLDLELLGLQKKLEPLDKEAATVQKRADALRDALAKIDQQIAQTQNSLISVKGQRLDKAAVAAEVATLRADRQAVQRDEPIIAAELDTLQPRIASLRAQRAAAQQKRAEVVAAEEADKKRVEELLVAIGAKRKVVDRAAAEAEAARDKVLFELGEKLYVDRPKKLAAQLAPIDAIDLELGEGERRIMELREILSNVDKAKMLRGIAFMTGVLVAVGLLATWIAMMAVG